MTLDEAIRKVYRDGGSEAVVRLMAAHGKHTTTDYVRVRASDLCVRVDRAALNRRKSQAMIASRLRRRASDLETVLPVRDDETARRLRARHGAAVGDAHTCALCGATFAAEAPTRFLDGAESCVCFCAACEADGERWARAMVDARHAAEVAVQRERDRVRRRSA